MTYRCLLASFIVFAGASLHAQGIITTIAGNGSIGYSGDGGPATSATLGSANGIVVDKSGNIYFTDSIFSVVRKVDAHGNISTFAGGGNPASIGDGGPATSAYLAFLGPHAGLAVDSAGNLYIADYIHGRIRKVDIASGNISTVAGSGTTTGLGAFSGDGGPAISAGLNSPTGVAFDSAGNMYIADYGNERVRKVDTTGTITTFAGIGAVTGSDSGDGGLATSAELGQVYDVAVDGKGNVYIADSEHVREVNSSGIVSTAAHGFFGTCNPAPTPVASADVAANGFAVDSAGNLYIADKSADCVQELETDGMVSAVAGGGATQGDGGPATSALLVSPMAVALDSAGNLYIATSAAIRKVTASSSQPSAKPIITPTTGVVNGASYTIGMAANTWMTITGTNFTTVTDSWTVTGGVLPTKLDGVSVTIDGLPAYVDYISPTQINVLTPANLTNQFPMVVVTNTVGSSVGVTVFNCVLHLA
jgi:sugar lactone lactonase YvrE